MKWDWRLGSQILFGSLPRTSKIELVCDFGRLRPRSMFFLYHCIVLGEWLSQGSRVNVYSQKAWMENENEKIIESTQIEFWPYFSSNEGSQPSNCITDFYQLCTFLKLLNFFFSGTSRISSACSVSFDTNSWKTEHSQRVITCSFFSANVISFCVTHANSSGNI